MGKSLIYTVNNTGAAVSIGNSVPIGSIIRRYGRCIDATGSAINLTEPGYYDVDITANVTAAAAGNVTLFLTQNGTAVPGAIATATITTANTQVENLSMASTIRVRCCGEASLAVVVGGTTAPTISNMAVRVVRVV